MTWPLEGSRETHEGIIISECLDWCICEGGTIAGYRLTALQREATNMADSVRQTDDRTHVKDSRILRCEGDGKAKAGIFSHSIEGACWPKTWSESVTAEGLNVVRHDDEWWMNNGNTWGRLYYTKLTDSAEVKNVSYISPKLNISRYYSSDIPHDADKYEALSETKGAALAKSAITIGAMLYGLTHRPKVGLDEPPGPKPKPGSRTSGSDECPCTVLPYGQLSKICAAVCGGEAHHIVPDFTKRWVGRELGKTGYGRVKGLPGYYEGASICLKGQAGDKNSEHYEAHGADARIERLGMHPDSPDNPKGTAPIDDIRDASQTQVEELRKECKGEIQTGVATEFAGVNPHTLGRTTIDELPTPNNYSYWMLRDGKPPTEH